MRQMKLSIRSRVSEKCVRAWTLVSAVAVHHGWAKEPSEYTGENISYTISYTILYDIIYDITLGKAKKTILYTILYTILLQFNL
jgi:hypothetical protein